MLLLLGCRDAPEPSDQGEAVDAAPLAVVVGEILAAGDPDWIELQSVVDEDVDLAGWTLTIGDQAPAPLGGVLAPRAFLVLEGGSIDGDGDVVTLTAPDGGTERVAVGNSWGRTAWARAADGCAGDCWEPVWGGTPGASNGLAAVRTEDLAASDATTESAWFEVDAAAVTALDLRVTAADGFEVFVDGEEVLRDHLPGGPLSPDTPSLGPRGPVTTVVRVAPRLLPGTTHVLSLRLHPPPGAAPSPRSLSLGVRGPTSPPAAPAPGRDLALPSLPPGSDTVFDATRVHAVVLELGPEAQAALDVDTQTYVPGVLTFDGQRVEGVTVRRRGKGGSRRPMGAKPKLRVDVRPGGEGVAFRGLGALLLDNLVQDCSGLKMPLAFEVFREAGNPAPRVGYARLTIDGEDKGLYALTEELDDAFVDAWWGDPDGVLIDGSYPNQPGEPLLLPDFEWDRLAWFDQEEGPPTTILGDVTAALDAWEQGLAGWPDALLDRPSFLAHFAAEEWVGHVDGLVLMPNNWWLVAPAGQPAAPIAWDTDQAFLRDFEWFIGSRWAAPGGRLPRLCRADPGCDADWEATLTALEDQLAGSDLAARWERLDALTRDDLLRDPQRECPADAVVPSREAVRAWIAGRTDELRAGGG